MFDEIFFNYLSNEKRYSAHTIRSYKSDLMQFVEFGKNLNNNFNPLTSDHLIIRKWIAFLMESGNTARSVNRKVTTLKTYYRFLLREGLITDLPTQKIVLPKMNKPLPYFVGSKNMQMLFDQFGFTDNFEGLRDRTILLTFYCTGMRLSELVNLKISDIDFYYSRLKVLGKRNKERLIPFDVELHSCLKQYITQRNQFNFAHTILYVTDNGDPVYDKFIYRLVNKYLGEVTTLEKRSPHVLRHTFATHMLDNGAELNAIKELLGHSSLAATQIYTHTSFEKLRHIYNQAHPRA